MIVEMLLAVKCSVIGVTLKKSGTLHRNYRREVFLAQPVGRGSNAGYYYDSPVYEDLSSVDCGYTTQVKWQ